MQTATEATGKEVLIDRLRESEEQFVAVASITEELAKIQPAEGRWSVLNVVEHITLADRGMWKRYESAVPAETVPVNPDADRVIEGLRRVGNTKRTAPEHVVPTGRFTCLSDALAEYRKGRNEIVAFVRDHNENFRSKKVQHPVVLMDGHQLFLLIAAHSDRHATQIENIKNSDAYQAAIKRSN